MSVEIDWTSRHILPGTSLPCLHPDLNIPDQALTIWGDIADLTKSPFTPEDIGVLQ
jgi:hypothetical protein